MERTKKMKSKKSKRVSWASGLSLCQVKLFKVEDPPSEVGQRAQKTETPRIPLMKWQCPPKVWNPKWQVVAGQESKEVGVQNQRIEQVLEALYPHPSHIPPRPFVGREVEGCYYDDSRTPVIPTDPIEEEVEEAADAPVHSMEPTRIQAVPEPSAVPQLCHGSTPPATKPPVNENATPDIVSSFGNLIDLDLLVKILSDQKVCESLVSEFGNQSDLGPAKKQSSLPFNFPFVQQSCPAPANVNSVGVHIPSSAAAPTYLTCQNSLPALVTPPLLKNKGDTGFGNQSDIRHTPERRSPSVQFIDPHSCPTPANVIQARTPTSAAPSTNVVTSMLGTNPPLHGFPQMMVPTVKAAPPVKDMNYYKSLIQLHGAEKPKHEYQNVQMGNNLNHSQLGPKVEQALKSKQRNSNTNLHQRSYNGPKRYRSEPNSDYRFNMPFQYNHSTSIPEIHSAKRMRPSWELTGRT